LLHKSGIKYIARDAMPVDVGEGDVVLTFGKARLVEMQQAGLGPKGRAVPSQRGHVLGSGEGDRWIVTYDPTEIEFEWERRTDISWDIRLAARLHNTGSLLPTLPEYEQVDDWADAIADVQARFKANNKRVPVGIDTETLGLDYLNPDAWIIAVSVSTGVGKAYVKHYSSESREPSSSDIESITWFCNAPEVKVYGANFKYDMLWFCEKWGIKTFDSFALDTTLVGSLLDENRSNSLNTHAKVYTQIGGYDDPFNYQYDKSRMDLVPQGDVVQYAGGDTDACLRVGIKMRKHLLQQKRLARFYTQLLHPAQHAVRKMEQRGMVVDVDEYNRLDDAVSQQMQTDLQMMIDCLPRYLRDRYKEDLRPTRPKIAFDFLFAYRGLNLTPYMVTEKTHMPSMAAEHLRMFEKHPDAGEFITAYLSYQKGSKTKSTYIDGFRKHVRSDGRFHPSYMLYRGKFEGDATKDDDSGGRTGRTSCKEPAYQTIPKHTAWAKPLRRVYVPPPGYVILNVDFSQGELRITACIADEPTMIQTYRDGIDLHLKTGAQLARIELDEAIQMMVDDDPGVKKIRQGGKAGNFGLIYEMGADGFVDYARTTFGLHLTLKEAQNFMRAFFDLYDQLPVWHDNTKQFAHENGYIESPLGRVRRVPLINSFSAQVRRRQERQAVNAGVQATLTDMGLLAMAELDRAYPDLWQFGFTHDAISFYVKEDEVDEQAARIKSVMENLPFDKFDWHPQLDFPVDIELGVSNLADVHNFDI
jgi:DNA polymerase I-like protein with 3'-5' exonuclease and polymerase domains